MRWIWLKVKGLQIFMRRIWPKRASDLCVESDWKGPPNIYALNLTKKGLWSMRWIWLKRASKYLCVEFDQKGPLIYALNLTEKGLLIFMQRISTKKTSDLSVESDWIKRASKYLCVESDQKGLWSIAFTIWLKRASKYICVESDQKGPLIYALNLTEKGLQIFMRRI